MLLRRILIPITFACRNISTTSVNEGKRNFRKFLLYNKRGSKSFKKAQQINPHPDIPIDKRGVRDTGFIINGKFMEVPQKIPQLVVPNLTDCKFKPYVSYKTADVYQSEFTSQDLFDSVYAEKIVKDFKEGKLNEDGTPKEASIDESLTPDQAWINARKTGSDIF